MAVLNNIAQIVWACDQSETFGVSFRFILPGWTMAELAGVRWHAQARDANTADLRLDFDSAANPPTIIAGPLIDGAGLDATGAPIPGVSVDLTFSQLDTTMTQVPDGIYPISVKAITPTDKTIIAAGTLTCTLGPTRE